MYLLTPSSRHHLLFLVITRRRIFYSTVQYFVQYFLDLTEVF
jgi:hypothetical protein